MLPTALSGWDTHFSASTIFQPRELRIDEVKSLDPVNLRKINMSDFLEAMKRIKKSVSADSLLPHEAWNQKFGECAS